MKGEAEMDLFGMNLQFLQHFMGKFHLGGGWIRYGDDDALEKVFWRAFSRGGPRYQEKIMIIKAVILPAFYGLINWAAILTICV